MLPSTSITGPMGMSGLMVKNVANITVPCKGCTYTYIKGDMVYKNGTSANLENGAYMHHITLISMPPGILDPQAILQGITAGASQVAGSSSNPIPFMKSSKPFYLIGNERLPLTFPKAGVYLSKSANLVLTVQLQNMEAREKEVYIDLDYDYLPGQPEGYTDIIPVSQDALGMDAMSGKIKQNGVWTKTSSPYKSGQDARILMMYGHVHDGGIHTEIMVNGKVKCDSLAFYQDMKVPMNVTTTTGHSHAKRDGPKGKNSHILSFGECVDVGMINKGDVITTKVYYDFTKRPATPLANGHEDALMGISMTYLGIPMAK
jgi:hypothetical protein